LRLNRVLISLIVTALSFSGEALAVDDSPHLKKLVERLRGLEGYISFREVPPRSDGRPDPQLAEKREVLKKLIAAGPLAVQPLTQALNDPDRQMRANVCQVFSELAYTNEQKGKSQKELRSALLNAGEVASKNANKDVRVQASSLLLETGEPYDKAIPIMVSLTKDSDAGVRSSAAVYLGMMLGKEKKLAPQYVSNLQSLLADKSAEVRSSAARGLFELGLPTAKGALPELKKLLKDTDKEVRQQAKTTIDALTR